MFQLLLLTLVSSTSVFLISAVQSFLSAAFIVSDCDECGFNDLGKLLFGGLAAAVVIGIAVALIVRRRDARS